MECRVRFYEIEVDERRRDFIYLVFGEGQRSGELAGGLERHAEETPARCDRGAESAVASVHAGEE